MAAEQPQQSPRTSLSPAKLLEERVMTENTFALGMQQMLEPLAQQHTEAVEQVRASQKELDDCVAALRKKLEDASQYSQLPKVGVYLQKLGDIKKRVTNLTTKLNNANDRLLKTHRYAEAQYGPLKGRNDAQQKKIDSWVESTGGSSSSRPSASPATASSSSTAAPAPATKPPAQPTQNEQESDRAEAAEDKVPTEDAAEKAPPQDVEEKAEPAEPAPAEEKEAGTANEEAEAKAEAGEHQTPADETK